MIEYDSSEHYSDPPYEDDGYFEDRINRRRKREDTVRDLCEDKIKISLKIISQEPTAYWRQKYAEAALYAKVHRSEK